jgi:hypothetical protein
MRTTKVYKRVYEDTAAMIAACDEAYKAGRRVNTAEDPAYRAGFIGRHYESWQDVLENANGNWPKGRQIVEEMLEALSKIELPQPASIRRKARWSEDNGDELDHDRLRSGQEYWRTTRRENLRGPETVSIVVNVTSPASMDAEDILWRGAAGVVLANLLEAAGYRVEFWAVQTASGGYTNGAGCFTALCLKRSEQPLDLGSLVNGVSGWFYRLMFFQAYYVETTARPSSGLGHVNGLWAAENDIEELIGNSTPVLVERVFSRSAALDLVRETLENLNQ